MRLYPCVDRLLRKFRRLVIAIGDGLISILTFGIAFYIRFDGDIPQHEWHLMLKSLPIVVLVRFGFFYYLGLYRGIWRYASIEDLMGIFRAVSLSSMALIVALTFVYGLEGFPRSIFIIDWLMLIILLGGSRFIVRAARASQPATGKGRRVLIFGAGDTGDALVRDLKQRESGFHIVGFVDDNPAKIGRHLHGVPVLGSRDNIIELSKSYQVDEIFIAIPTASGRLIRELISQFQEMGVKFRRVPAIRDLVNGRVTVQHLRKIELEDLLGREPVRLDIQQIGQFLQGKVVLVTGAGGSIGSELCRQILKFQPGRLLMLDQAETGLFHLGMDLEKHGLRLQKDLIVGDVTDRHRVREIFRLYRPEVVFHAAAHKHVPMMEMNKKEAVKNNVLGTKVLGEAALEFKVKKFVMISTDKAVNPTSIMGASKRVAELYLQSLQSRGMTKFITVRFGNVLGSEGSVVPVFKRQILAGGPVLVTHPDVQRYFMTISEAVQLVIQAGAMGEGGEIFVLDMGDPIRILDLAKNLITLSGYKVEDIGIQFTGLRPGEKLFEELWVAEENIKPTAHEKIFVANGVYPQPSLHSQIDILLELLREGSEDDVVKVMQSIVPSYQPPNSTSKNAECALPDQIG